MATLWRYRVSQQYHRCDLCSSVLFLKAGVISLDELAEFKKAWKIAAAETLSRPIIINSDDISFIPIRCPNMP